MNRLSGRLNRRYLQALKFPSEDLFIAVVLKDRKKIWNWNQHRNKYRELDIPKLEPPTTYMGIISDLSIWHQKTNHPAMPLASLNSFVLLLLQLDLFAFFGILIVVVCGVCVCVCAKWKCDRRANKIQMCGDCRSARTVASSYDCQTEQEKEREHRAKSEWNAKKTKKKNTEMKQNWLRQTIRQFEGRRRWSRERRQRTAVALSKRGHQQ